MSKSETKPKSKVSDAKVANLEQRLAVEKEKLAAEKLKLAEEKKRIIEERKKHRSELKAAKDEAKHKAALEKQRIKAQEKAAKDAIKFRENEEKQRIKEKAKRDLEQHKKTAAESLRKEKTATKTKIAHEKELLKEEKKRTAAIERENAALLSRRAKIEEELNKRNQSIVDYKGKIQELNKNLADALKNRVKTEEDGNSSSKKINLSYRELKKQVDFEVNEKRFFREQIKHKLKQISKESESGVARMGAKSLMGAGNFISDRLNEFADSLPVVSQLNTARKFVKENMTEAREAKLKRITREKMTEARSDKSKSGKGPFDDLRQLSERGRNDDKNREKENKTNSYFQEILSTLKSIRMGQLLNTFASMGGGFIKAITTGVGAAFETVFNKLGIKKILAGLAGALGAKKIADKLMPGGIDIDIDNNKPDNKKTKSKPSSGGPGTSTAPSTTRPSPSPTPSPNNKKGFFERMKGKVSTALSKASTKGAAMTLAKVGARFLGPIGAAMTIYEVADHFGLVDEANSLFDSAMKDWFGDDESDPNKSQTAPAGASVSKPSNGLPPSLVNTSDAIGTYTPQLSSELQTKHITHFDPQSSTLSTQIEAAHDKVLETERISKETERLNNIYEASKYNDNSAINSNINNVNTINNNSTNVIHFNNSEYQTSYQKGTQVIR